MCTYGERDVGSYMEEAAYFQPHHEIREIEEEIGVLNKKKREIIKACHHHFVPRLGMLHLFKETLVPGVVTTNKAAKVVDGIFSTGAITELKCIRCHTTRIVDIADHCPVCANIMTHKQTGSGPSGIGRYFEEYPYYVVPIEASCTKCDFKLVTMLQEGELSLYTSTEKVGKEE